MLQGLARRPWYNEHMGCIMGCLDYLGIEMTPGWLYGGTGHAFVLNMNDTVFVDCPMAWDTPAHFDLYTNLGFSRQGVLHDPRRDPDVSPEACRDHQRQAWDMARMHMDRGLPCYAWELSHVPSYYLITGYDEVGYYFSAHIEGGPCPWDKIGTFDVRQVALHIIAPAQPAADEVVVRDALNTVLARVERPNGWTIANKYRSGLPAYDLWAESLQEGRAARRGSAYVNRFWLECRQRAVEFFQEAEARLPGRCDPALVDAATHYAEVVDALSALMAMSPEPEDGDWFTPFQSDTGARLVRRAAAAESRGIAALRLIAESVSQL